MAVAKVVAVVENKLNLRLQRLRVGCPVSDPFFLIYLVLISKNMNFKLDIPHFESPDDNHCFQACLKMILKYLISEKNFSFKKLDEISKHIPNKWTWQGASLLYLADLGFQVVNIENLDYELFAKKDGEYLKTIWTPEVFEAQSKFSDLEQEQIIAQKLIINEKIKLINKDISLDDIIDLINNDYVVMVSINPYVIRKEKGYSSHMVVIDGIEENYIIWHDPGPPGEKSKKTDFYLFEKSITKPEKEDGNIIGVKKISVDENTEKFNI